MKAASASVTICSLVNERAVMSNLTLCGRTWNLTTIKYAGMSLAQTDRHRYHDQHTAGWKNARNLVSRFSAKS